MEILWGNAIWAGVVGTVVMTALMYMGKAMGMRMDMPRMLGLMFAPPEKSVIVYAAGGMAHLMMGVLFAIAYALVFAWADWQPTAFSGGVIGLVHGIIAGLFMGMMPAMHPRMGPGKALPPPGPFAKHYGGMVPFGLVMLHIVYGALVGWLYGG